MEDVRGYRLLAGAIIAKSVEDMVDLLIFIRDIGTPDNADLIYRRADRNYKKYRRVLASNEERKRKIRKEIAEDRRNLQCYQDAVEKHMQAMLTHTVPELREDMTAEERSIIRKQATDAARVYENHKKSIAKLDAEMAQKTLHIEYLKDRIRRMKAEEKQILMEASQVYQKKYLLRRARREIEAIECWLLYSDQFTRLNAVADFDPVALVEKGRRAVNKGMQHPSNKFKPYFLQGDSDE